MTKSKWQNPEGKTRGRAQEAGSISFKHLSELQNQQVHIPYIVT